MLGTFDAAVTECLEPLEKTLLTCTTLEGVPKEELSKGMDLIKSKYQQKMEPISNKLEVSFDICCTCTSNLPSREVV